jgi:hypothetical protein
VGAVGAASAAVATVKAPPGAGRPVAASGIGTSAALNNPKCTHDDPRFSVYGRFNSTTVGGGAICVKPWKDGDDNGGATSPGVTKDSITVVAVVPNESQLSGTSAAAGTAPVRKSDQSIGTYADAVHDYFLPLMKYYETWGRDVDVKFVTSSGSDESSQRADAVTVKAEKPFAVLDLVTAGLDVLDAELAKSKILVSGDATTTAKATAQAPYRWGLSDAQAAAVNAGEVIGKQLVGKKAEYAGGDITKQTRKFGAVYIPQLIDIDQFKSYFSKYGGTLTTESAYTSNGTTFGDDALAQEQAPIIVTKMKSSGVTTVVLLSDVAMNKAMMAQATKQEWFPEWFITGAVFQDIAIFARSYDQQQFAHAFGESNLSPYVQLDPVPEPPAKSLTVQVNPLEWYFGAGVGTQVTSVVPREVAWLLNGIQTAGPQLTAKTFQQGLFSIPAFGGAAQGYTTGALAGYGRTPGLPYDEYLNLGLDFGPMWWDADSTGLSNGTGISGKGVVRYVDGGKRYNSGNWPKKPFAWFEKEGSVVDFATRQTPTPVYVGDCTDCPAAGGPGQAGSPSNTGFVAKAYGLSGT